MCECLRVCVFVIFCISILICNFQIYVCVYVDIDTKYCLIHVISVSYYEFMLYHVRLYVNLFLNVLTQVHMFLKVNMQCLKFSSIHVYSCIS